MKIFYGEILRQTRKAVEYKFEERRIWIPVSQILNEDLPMGIVDIPEWLAKAKGLEAYRVRSTLTYTHHRGVASGSSAGHHGNTTA